MREPDANTFVVTGPTSGIGLRAALALAAHGAVVLVGRNSRKLGAVQQRIEREGGKAFSVVCDLSDPASVRGPRRRSSRCSARSPACSTTPG